MSGELIPDEQKAGPATRRPGGTDMRTYLAKDGRLRAIVALGRIAHDSMLRTLQIRSVLAPFAHGAVHQAGALKLYDSYHCSRYNTNTRVLTPAMFEAVFARVRADLDQRQATKR